MPKPVCVKCQRFFRPRHNGYWWTEGMPRGTGVPPGKEHADAWVPYKLWNGDLYECQGCGHQIVVGHSVSPIAEHYQQERFNDLNQRSNVQVNDC